MPCECITKLYFYNYEIKYKNNKGHGNADELSRLPITEQIENYDVVDIFQMQNLETLPITAIEVASYTSKDPD